MLHNTDSASQQGLYKGVSKAVSVRLGLQGTKENKLFHEKECVRRRIGFLVCFTVSLQFACQLV